MQDQHLILALAELLRRLHTGAKVRVTIFGASKDPILDEVMHERTHSVSAVYPNVNDRPLLRIASLVEAKPATVYIAPEHVVVIATSEDLS